jgi:CRISPR-associated protein Cas2
VADQITRPARRTAQFVVVYDVSSDAERRRVDKLLKDFGFRVQLSVFECRLSARLRRELISKLESLQLQTGFVKLYRENYSSNSQVIGQAAPGVDDGHSYIV